jgi:hypothetical protein
VQKVEKVIADERHRIFTLHTLRPCKLLAVRFVLLVSCHPQRC